MTPVSGVYIYTLGLIIVLGGYIVRNESALLWEKYRIGAISDPPSPWWAVARVGCWFGGWGLALFGAAYTLGVI